jgi:hypothetical protein
MSRRAFLALSGALTAFVLVLLGASAAYLVPHRPSASNPTPDAVPVEVVRAITPAPDVAEARDERRHAEHERGTRHERHERHEREHEDDDG